ncbi:hypothetical protein F5141DRAFT_1247376 [Pisolithus sp. B1]|nr:hypothetical protein F5141DRAFT_1247376 [Pisolithus sp. B1]
MSFEGDPLAFYGENIISDYHAFLMTKLPEDRGKKPNTDKCDDDSDDTDKELRFFPEKKIGILGAGVGGLYTALILDSLGIDFEILEASGRVGGRLSTYKFAGGRDYDYYDAGAMRFPLPKKNGEGKYKNGIMKRLAELIVYLPLNKGSDPLKDRLIPYYYEAREGINLKPGFYYFNGVRERISSKPGHFRAEEIGVAASYIKVGTDAIHTDVVKPFAALLIEDIKKGKKAEGWQLMMAHDSYSVRAYMAFKYIPSGDLDLPRKHLPHKVINWCEVMENSTKSYDHGLTEEVFESLAFAKIKDHDFGDVDWQCFDGGSEVLPRKMAEVVNLERIHFDKRVTAIRPASDNPGLQKTIKIVIPGAGVEVSTNRESRVYSHVISTLPLPVLRSIDTEEAGLNILQKNALRQLQYGPSVKIAILFKEAWWTTKLDIVGGQSFTDLPIRTIVYPSYGVGPNASRVLIASYCWTTDAERLGSLATPEKVEVLKELVLRNLAEVHGPPITYEFLRSRFIDIHIKDWTHDALTMGAFAHFGPGDFRDLYTSLTYPTENKRLHFAGEAISTRHAWVVGALDSAWRAVHEYLCVTGQEDKKKDFKKLWGENIEWASPSVLPVFANRPNLLEEHLGLVSGAISAGKIRM